MSKKILFLPAMMVLLAVGIITYTHRPAPQKEAIKPQEQPKQVTYPVPTIVQPVVARLGLDQSTLEKMQIFTPLTASSCSSSDLSTAVSCHGWHSITLPQPVFQQDPIEQDRVLAHEYMHEIWANMSVQERNNLIQPINEAYAKQASIINTRLEGYTLDDQMRADELHSFICTEMNDSEIPHPLLDHCKKYLPNRMALPTYY